MVNRDVAAKFWMKKRWGRGISVILTSAFVVGLLSGCGSTAMTAESEKVQEGAKSSSSNVTLEIEVYERGEAPTGTSVTDNYLTQFAQTNFGDPNGITLEYVPVPRSEDVQKLNVMMASGEVPDIIFTYDENLVYNYAKQGGLTELDSLLDEHGSNLKSFLGEETLEYGVFEGTQYAVPAKRVNIGKYASYIRQDWLDELSLPAPQTTDEVYETLKAFKEKKPGGADQVIPLGFSLTPASYEPIIWGLTEKLTEEQSITLTHQLGSRDYPTLLPGHKEALRFLNKLYLEGLMSPDFALDKDKKKLNQDIQTGKVGMFGADSIEPLHETYKNLKTNVSGAKLTAIDPYTNSTGDHFKPLYKPAGLYIIIPKASKHAAEAIQYLDWMAQEDTLFLMQNGEETKHYSLEEGIPVRLDTEDAKKDLFNTGDMAIISNGQDFGDAEKNKMADLMSLSEEDRELGKQVRDITLVDGVKPVRFDKPLESQIKYGTLLQEKYDELVARSILAKANEFDATYDMLLGDMMKSGGEAILKERHELYQAMKKQ
ncbi:lipoprotein LipO [Paenibacillus sp. J45TS6]|uniref:extracellular solute-binding protein n=1 Tax=unclassified Paenibacillus TaxID=185978 RepID=UPI001B036FDB|nr:extracellular solute-binding protein [Paenibacillus sp. J45TS6]GIP42694.1 lipoprotein LipO [Paenibacillus sp. J45TS6]